MLPTWMVDVMEEMQYLLAVGVICMLFSLALAWLASLIVYVKFRPLKRAFPATHQLIRAHIDYLLMSLLLFVSYFLSEHLSLSLPTFIVALTCIGAIYNPFGFIFLAMKPELANPKTVLEKTKILIGFLPATIGFGYVMVAVLIAIIEK